MIEFIHNRTFTESDFFEFIGPPGNGKTLSPLPHAQPIDPLEFLNLLASGGHGMVPKWGYARLPEDEFRNTRSQWTQFFLTTHMRRGLDGSGYAVTWGGARWIEGKSYQTPIVRRFAICKHEKEDAPGANHSRGWHPGHCKLCGMDMTYDSGD